MCVQLPVGIVFWSVKPDRQQPTMLVSSIIEGTGNWSALTVNATLPSPAPQFLFLPLGLPTVVVFYLVIRLLLPSVLSFISQPPCPSHFLLSFLIEFPHFFFHPLSLKPHFLSKTLECRQRRCLIFSIASIIWFVFWQAKSYVEVVVPQCINTHPTPLSSSVCTSELKPFSPSSPASLHALLISPLSSSARNHDSGSPLITLPGNSSSQKVKCFIFVVWQFTFERPRAASQHGCLRRICGLEKKKA